MGMVSKLFNILEVRMAGLALLLAVLLSIASPLNFFSLGNFYNLLDQSVVIGIIAIGMTFVILTGGIDLSVGSVVGLTGILLGLSLRELPVPAAILVAVGAGAAIGVISGMLVSYFGLPAFVVTLGMMVICRSQAFVISHQQPISGLPDSLSDLAYGSLFGFRVNVLILFTFYLAAWFYLGRTRGGRTIYAVGSNAEAARIAGLKVRLYTVLPYAVSGGLSAVAAILMAAQISSIDPLAGNQMELDAIAAVVIGGASLFGGRGSVIGTLFGVFIMIMIRNGLNMLGVSSFWQGTAIGIMIIAAVLTERLMSLRAR